MAQLLVRRIPEHVMRDLKAIAADHGVSLEEYVRQMLSGATDTRARWRAFARWSREFLAKQPPSRPGEPSGAQLIREDRDSR